MAQTTGPESRTRGGTSASTNGTNGTNTTGDGGVRRGFSLSGLSALLSPRSAGKATGTNGTSAQPQRANTGMGKFLKGWLILVVGMYVVQFGLIILDANAFGGWLEKHYIAGTGPGGTHPGSAFLLGGMTWFLLIFIALFAGLYYALVKFKILPKDLFGGARGSQTQANARAGGSTARGGSGGTRAASPSSPPPLPSGVNPYADHSRAARREAQRRAAVAAVAPQPKRGLFGRSKPAAPVAAAATVATAAKKQTRAVETSHATTSADNHYQRVRAEQRQRKRRAARR